MRRRLSQLHDLQLLQRAERDIAVLEHADAATRADAAHAAASCAASEAAALAEGWYAGRAERHFQPELDLVAAAGLVAAERRAADGRLAAASADGVREERAGAWRTSEARHRATAVIVAATRRRMARANDESGLDVVASRALARWRAP